jgi:hypothetical protein
MSFRNPSRWSVERRCASVAAGSQSAGRGAILGEIIACAAPGAQIRRGRQLQARRLGCAVVSMKCGLLPPFDAHPFDEEPQGEEDLSDNGELADRRVAR